MIYFANYWTITRLFEFQNNEKLFEEFVEKIAQNKDKFSGFSIVSSSDSSFIKAILGKEIKLFDIILGFDHSHSKEEKIQQITKKYNLNLNQIIYITDTTTDILELQILPKTNLFGVNWGYQSFCLLYSPSHFISSVIYF